MNQFKTIQLQVEAKTPGKKYLKNQKQITAKTAFAPSPFFGINSQ
jgi:hypothetical protein